MAVDAVTAELVAALADAGIDSVLLKGPTVAGWLYDDPADRPYVDSDLLVDPARLDAAVATLEGCGFRAEFGPLPHSGMEDAPSYPWRRESFVVDVHRTLPGATADPRRVWAVLRAGCGEQQVAGRTVQVLAEPARLAHVALHVAHHGARTERPLRDLGRALEVAGDDEWAAAADVAARIGASAAFAAGLAWTAEGAWLLPRLGLEAPASGAWALRTDGVPLAAGFERLGAAAGLRAKGAILCDEVFPSAAFMRWWTPLARRSRRGLVAAYAWRWLYLARHAPGGLRARRRARMAPR